MAGDDDEPATKGELRHLGAELRGEMKELGAELRGEMKQLGADLRVDIRADLAAVVAHALQVQQEQFQAWARAFDDKYKELPGRVTRVENRVDDLEGRMPPAAPPRRRKAGR